MSTGRIIEHGDRFGKLTALRQVKTSRGSAWRCGCACGFSDVIVRAAQLHRGRVTSCLKCRKSDTSR